jgi:hypothetical protein
MYRNPTTATMAITIRKAPARRFQAIDITTPSSASTRVHWIGGELTSWASSSSRPNNRSR